jgi:succinate dehydrogenase/fumarate reductase flavoprotein subunit
MLEHGRDVLLHGRGTRLVNGNALAARLFKTVRNRKIALWPSTRAVSLEREDSRVVGAVVEREGGQRVQIKARLGVVLASGGFPGDDELRKAHFKHVKSGAPHATLAAEGSTGDGLRMAGALSAEVNDSYANAAAWVPVSLIKRRDGSIGRFFHLIDRAKPGIIAVAADGRRFTNESHNYHDFVRAMIEANAGKPDVSAFLICDHRALRRYGLGAVRPAPLPISSFIRSGYLKTGRTIRDLAVAIGVDPAALQATIEAVNRDAREGVDRAFGRGSTSYQRLLGDPDFAPNPCVGELAKPPFYAVKIIPGDIGTYHGLVTDECTRVLDGDGNTIEGLFAVGNDAASMFGGSYPGAGATLGPAMTFGYVCGTYLARKAANPTPDKPKALNQS